MTSESGLPSELTPADLRQLEASGISPEAATLQIRRLREGIRPPRLVRPCKIGDGIGRLPEDTSELEEEFRKACVEGRILHFIPASGAASRMAESLEKVRHHRHSHPAISALLEGEASLSGLSKALAPFHSYGSRVVTPVEEHIREAAALAGPGVSVRLHFTVAPEYEARFRTHTRETLDRLFREGIRAEVTHSLQDASTQTLALDEKGKPFRAASGELLLRPGGHGALLPNLEACGAEFAWIHNVDNIAVEPHRAKGRRTHQALAGNLIRLARERKSATRPLRVCGMVPNTGEPGGGPFWVSGQGGEEIRIVESAEVDATGPGQMEIFKSATHFNPVDMICALRDSSGHPYRLSDFSDPEACFMAHKTHEGRKLLALEWPGLWNGGMAHWDTVCVEIPLTLFTPVKTAMDLLKPEHME